MSQNENVSESALLCSGLKLQADWAIPYHGPLMENYRCCP